MDAQPEEEPDLTDDCEMSQNDQPKYETSYTTKDPDEAFLHSCLPILKRLPKKKNILARLRIQQILFELEFDEKYCPQNQQ
jgi:hypothetical protein